MKKLVLFLLCCLLLLCSASVGYCSGKLSDLDGFETYMGKSKSVVQIISPNYVEEPGGGKSYCVDYVSFSNGGYAALYVNFDEKDVVYSVSVVMDPDTVELTFDGNIAEFYSYSIALLGLDPADLLDAEVQDDARVYGYFKGSILCGASNTGEIYLTVCHYSEE